jgi:saccharopine dehydrogenase-like NADP-dependent oxidoreductase
MATVTVLGGGMVGGVIATDLAGDAGLRVVVADNRPEALARCAARADRLGVRLETRLADLGDGAQVTALAKGSDVVCGAMGSGIALGAMRAVIEAGRSYCDISFMPEDFTQLHTLAQERGVTVVPDCGVAPGMSHMLAAASAAELEACDEVDIFVGGLPVERRWPFEYKAGFSPSDVIEEYTRPARLIEHSKVVTREALSEPELIDLPGVGTLEAFNTDGLRSLLETLRVPRVREKTLRYPGHIDLMRVLRHIGLMGAEAVEVSDADGQLVRVRPRELLAKLMFPHWTYGPGEADLTVMRVEARGKRGGKPARVAWDLLDHYDQRTQTTSMARTTAFPCAIVTRMLLDEGLKGPGVLPPERLAAMPGVLDDLLAEQARRDVRYIATR